MPPLTGPGERLLQLGEPRLSDAECLALIVGDGDRAGAAEAMARRILDAFGGLRQLARAGISEIAAVAGVRSDQAVRLSAAFGLARRLVEERFRPGTAIRDAADVAALIRETVRRDFHESLHAILLDTRHRVLAQHTVGVGGLDSAPVAPREVFGPAVRSGAAAVILAHNHPSGDAAPSGPDREVTARLRRAGALLGIELLDHVIVGADRHYSFASEGFGGGR